MRKKWGLAFLFTLMGATCFSTAIAEQSTDLPQAAPAIQVASTKLIQAWREKILNITSSTAGCFHAKYPSIVLESVPCKPSPSRPFSLPSNAWPGTSKTVGNGYDDYVLVAPTAASSVAGTIGSFSRVAGVTSITSEDDDPSRPNGYALIIGTNAVSKLSACIGYDCTGWQTFIYTTNYDGKGNPGLFMQYWLLQYAGFNCPSGWTFQSGPEGEYDCWKNSGVISVSPQVPITQLKNMQLWASSDETGDMVGLQAGNEFYSYHTNGSVLGIYQGWQKSEFNIFGDGGGATAVFNPGSSLTVAVQAKYANYPDKPPAPTCKRTGVGIGPSNNLTLGSSCTTSDTPIPPSYSNYSNIQFTESN